MLFSLYMWLLIRNKLSVCQTQSFLLAPFSSPSAPASPPPAPSSLPSASPSPLPLDLSVELRCLHHLQPVVAPSAECSLIRWCYLHRVPHPGRSSPRSTTTAASPPLPPPVRHTYFQDGETTQKHTGAEASLSRLSPGRFLLGVTWCLYLYSAGSVSVCCPSDLFLLIICRRGLCHTDCSWNGDKSIKQGR